MTGPDVAGLVAGLADLDDAVGRLEKYRDASADLDTDRQADAIALVMDLRQRLSAVEADLAATLGQAAGKLQGNLSDGRQFTLTRSADRKEWDHDDWKRDVRRVIAERHAGADDVAVCPTTGEAAPLRRVLQEALAEAQAVHGSTSPKSTSLKGLGLYAGDYCTSSPGGWRLNAVKPHPTTETTTNGDD